MNSTAFVTHPDCSRHDTGWSHPDHQGRLPALSRAVYLDMLALYEPLLEVEGRHASWEEVRLAHSEGYLETVRGWVTEAERLGQVIEPVEGVRVSGATWDASTAAVGCALTGVDFVLEGQVASAFCAIRPSGQYAGWDRPGRFSLLDPVAAVARYLVRTREVAPVLVVAIGGTPGIGAKEQLDGDPDIDLLMVPAEGTAFPTRVQEALDEALRIRKPSFVVLCCDFSGLAGDPVGDAGLASADYYAATAALREAAERTCDGRLVSILGGGYDIASLGRATVDHLRALAGLPPA